jgi:hypothetical protein
MYHLNKDQREINLLHTKSSAEMQLCGTPYLCQQETAFM